MAEFTELRDLNVSNNQIVDIAPLAGHTELRVLDLDLNSLDATSVCVQIPTLEGRGTAVDWTDDPQIACPEPSAARLQFVALITLFVVMRQRRVTTT